MASQGKKAIAESYDALHGGLYDVRYRDEQSAKYDEILRNARFHADDLILDVGCGTGLLLRRLRAAAVGLDLSQGLLSEARRALRRRKGVHLIRGDAERLPFRGGVFRNALAVTVIQNTPEPEHALREMRRVARPGSRIVVTALRKAFSAGELGRLLSSSGLADHAILDSEELRDLLAFAVR